MEGPVYSTLWRKDRTKKGTSILKAFCDSKWWCLFFYTLNVHIKFVVDTSGFRTTLTGSTSRILSALIEDLRRRRRIAQHWKSGASSRYVSKVVCAIISCILVTNCVLYVVQRAKQPIGTLLCRLYTCEYLGESKKFSINHRELVNGQEWWKKRRVTIV